MNYEITFEWPNGDWTWRREFAEDFHELLLRALLTCPRDARVHHIERMHA